MMPILLAALGVWLYVYWKKRTARLLAEEAQRVKQARYVAELESDIAFLTERLKTSKEIEKAQSDLLAIVQRERDKLKAEAQKAALKAEAQKAAAQNDIAPAPPAPIVKAEATETIRMVVERIRKVA